MRSSTYHQKTIIVEGDTHSTTDVSVIHAEEMIFLRQDSIPDEEGNYRVNMIQVTGQQAAELVKALIEVTIN